MIGTWSIKHKDKNGNIIFEETRTNCVVNDGENSAILLEAFDPALNVKDGETILIIYDLSIDQDNQ